MFLESEMLVVVDCVLVWPNSAETPASSSVSTYYCRAVRDESADYR
jgi:hypothetical protein